MQLIILVPNPEEEKTVSKATALLKALKTLKELQPSLSMSKELRPDFENVARELAKEGGEWVKILLGGLNILLTTAASDPSVKNLVKLRAKGLRNYYQELVKAGFKPGQAMDIILAERGNAKKLTESLKDGLSTVSKHI